MTYRDRQRVGDITAAIEAIAAHLRRGDLCDGLVFDAVRMRDHLAHRYFDTSHAILQATVDHDLPELHAAIHRIDQRLAAPEPAGSD